MAKDFNSSGDTRLGTKSGADGAGSDIGGDLGSDAGMDLNSPNNQGDNPTGADQGKLEKSAPNGESMSKTKLSDFAFIAATSYAAVTGAPKMPNLDTTTRIEAPAPRQTIQEAIINAAGAREEARRRREEQQKHMERGIAEKGRAEREHAQMQEDAELQERLEAMYAEHLEAEARTQEEVAGNEETPEDDTPHESKGVLLDDGSTNEVFGTSYELPAQSYEVPEYWVPQYDATVDDVSYSFGNSNVPESGDDEVDPPKDD